MSYYLSSNDVKVLKQTISTVNNIATGVGQGKRPTIKNAFAYAELTEEDANGFWSAFEVYFDETGTPIELTDGRTWGGDEPSIIVNGDVSAGQVMRIESYYLVDSNEEEQAVWVGSAVGGGTNISRVRIPTGASLGYNSPYEIEVEVLDNSDQVIDTVPFLIQRKFSQAIIYENEILKAELDGDVCDVTISMNGIGGTSA